MKKNIRITCVFTVLVTLIYSMAQAQNITTPRTPSPAAKVSQTIGISTISVSYSRPSVKNRDVWGKIVPYGYTVQNFGSKTEAPWRAGANENTTIEFSHEAKVEGQLVPAGTYGLFFVINKDETGEVILSKDNRSWGSFWYNPSHDQLRAKIQLHTIGHTELLTYDFMNPTKNAVELVLNWEKKQFPVKVEFSVDEIVMANATEELKGPTGFSWQGYSSAANYALQNKVNLDKAMGWIDQAIVQNKSFATLNVKAGILKQMGKNEESEKIMNDVVAIATENELNLYGYQLINERNLDKAIEILKMNTQRFSKSANTWDSLGEAYAIKGDKENAIKNFKIALSLNPPAATKENSEKFLKQFGAM